MHTKDFVDKYQPERFEHVWGQPQAVKLLSGLITKGKIGRNLLFYGAVGSGKTSSVRLYAKALNCLHPTETGSACGTCPRCSNPGWENACLYEYDVSGRGGDKKRIKAFVDELNKAQPEGQRRVLFFDEAHSLSPDAADSLLKDVEGPKPGVIFCFATTEFGRIRPALRSRLIKIKVRPLTASDAIGFLQAIADREDIPYEPAALALLAGVTQGYPRDLLKGLEQVHKLAAGRVTAEHVRQIFDIDHTQVLVEYFLALADGDSARQTQLMCGWAEPAADKIRWVSAFLLALYYTLLGKDLIVDPLIHSIQQERPTILDRFQARLRIENRKELTPYWLRMLEFWDNAVEVDDAAALLRLTLFQVLVNEDLPKTRSPGDGAGLVQEAEPGSYSRPSRPRDQDRPRPAVWKGESEFFEPGHAREVIDRASFLIQEHRLLFNYAFEVRAKRFGVDSEAGARRLVEEFCHDLEEQARGVDAQGSGLFAHLTLLERAPEGVRGLIVAHLPQPARTAVDANRLWRQDVASWASSWRMGNGAVLFAAGPDTDKNALKFHWQQALNLCAGLDEGAEEWDPKQGRPAQLLNLLKIPRSTWRASGPVKGSLILTSGILAPEAVELASRGGMEPLSAYDDHAWDWLRRGREFHEFDERSRLRRERDAKIREINQTYRADTAEALAATEKLVSSWLLDPRERPRKWQGWWE